MEEWARVDGTYPSTQWTFLTRITTRDALAMMDGRSLLSKGYHIVPTVDADSEFVYWRAHQKPYPEYTEPFPGALAVYNYDGQYWLIAYKE